MGLLTPQQVQWQRMNDALAQASNPNLDNPLPGLSGSGIDWNSIGNVDTSSFFTPYQLRGDNEIQGREDPAALKAWLDANGYNLMGASGAEATGSSRGTGVGIQDAAGKWVVDPQMSGGDPHFFRDAALTLGLGATAGYGLGALGGEAATGYGAAAGATNADLAAGLVGGVGGPGSALTMGPGFVGGAEGLAGYGGLEAAAAGGAAGGISAANAGLNTAGGVGYEGVPLQASYLSGGLDSAPAGLFDTPAASFVTPALSDVVNAGTVANTAAQVADTPVKTTDTPSASDPFGDFSKWAKANPEIAKLLFMGGGAAVAGGGGPSGGGGYVDSGYRPNVQRGGFLASAQPTLSAPQSVAPRGLIAMPGTKGVANSGLWQYGLLGRK